MCTAICYRCGDSYFGRNLDLHRGYGEGVVIMPRHYEIKMRCESPIASHYAMIGMAIVVDDFPLYYEATNEMGLSSTLASSQFRKSIPVKNDSLGMGALGLPGDFSSTSRFIRALFVKEHSVSEHHEASNVTQFFHILNAVAMPKGCVQGPDGFEYTRYSSCCNADAGIYYYTTYDEPAITAISMHGVALNGSRLYTYEVKGLS